MKKNFFLTSFILLTLTLTACSATASATRGAGASVANLPTQTKLVLGTINLEKTDYAITTEQATELLPMFYVLQELNDSGSAAQEEIDGLVNQIQGTLTADQTQAIDDMSLSMRDVFAITQANSGNSGSSNTTSTSSAGGPPDMGGMSGGGGAPGGDMPGAMPSGGTASASSNKSAAPVMDTSTPSALFDAVIELLQKKVQS